MFQLFKKRNFSELVGDTFTFFKMHGKHYYRNYFIINGGFLLLLLVLVYFVMNIFIDIFIAGFASGLTGVDSTSNINALESNVTDNLPLVIGLGIFAVIAALFLSILSYVFPVAYLKLQENETDFSTGEIMAEMKSKIGKIVVFSVASIFIMFPLMLVVMAICFALVFLVIGIPLLFIVIPAMVCWSSISFYEYISTDKGYFESLGSGFTLLKQKFWPSVGSTAVIYLITQIVIGIFTMIPYLIGIFSMFTAYKEQNNSGSTVSPDFSFFAIMMVITMVLSLLMSFVFQNFMLVNQGIIYYSLREENENNISKSEIDLIGLQGE